MANVAVVRSWFLPISETFIYSELVNLKKFSPIVCTKKMDNFKLFPFKPIYQFKNLNDLKKILQKKKVGLIHARFGLTGAEILPIKRKLGIPMLTSFHGFDLPSNRKSYKKYGWRLKSLFKSGEAFTVTSKNMRDILIRYGCPKNKIFVHHSGINVDKFKFKPRRIPKDQNIILLSVGRLVEKKGMDDLIDAFYKVQKAYHSISLCIAGDGPLRKKLSEKVEKLGLEKKVKFLGEIRHNQVMKEMEKAHLFALASTKDRNGNQEGIPNVLKEAMASGLPIISTRHAGIPELVSNGKSGFLVKEKNPNEFAKKLLELINSPDKWEKMGNEGRKKVVKSYNIEIQISHLESIYERVLKGKV